MTMATQNKLESRGSKSAMLRKQTEIEETEEQDTSPGSDQSDATITASGEGQNTQSSGGGSPNGRRDSQLDDIHTTNHIQVNPKVKQLTRSQAFEDMSPPPEQSVIHPESNTNGIYVKSQGKNKLEKSGSQSSEAGTSSSLSRESSFDHPYKDSTGINLEDFIHKTLNKTPKDRNMLLKLETDLTNFINEPKHHYLKFPQMSSYDRMLVHRIAAFFGLDHNVDQTGKCVIVNKTSNTRVPDFCFQDHIDAVDHKGKPKVIMKRHGLSLDDKESHSKHDRMQLQQMREVRSLEERQKQYENARRKIFSRSEDSENLQPLPFSKDQCDEIGIILKKPSRPCSLSTSSDGHTWSSTESSGYGTDNSSKSRGIPKANSFGGLTSSYSNHHMKSPHKSQSFNKSDSVSSGASSMGSPMNRQLPTAPTPPGRSSGSSPLSRSSSSGPVQSPVQQGFLSGQGQQVYWVASDIRNVPPGSVIINPQTGQPMSNPDGSLYHHNPGQQTPSQPPQPQPIFTHQFTTEETRGQVDLCQHLSRVSLNQPPLESVGDPPGSVGTPGGAPYIVGVQPHPGIQSGFTQHPNQVMQQGQFYQGQQNMAGQSVRYVYPVNYSGQTPSGQGQQNTVTIENPTQTFNPSMNQFPNQFTPSYPGYQTGGTSAPGQNVENFSSTNFSQTAYPTPQGESSVGGYSTYPVQYSQSSFGGQNSSTMFYSTVPGNNPQMGISYSGQQQIYNSTTPPSQQTNATTPNVAIHNVPQQPVNVGQPPTGNTQTATTPQYMYPTIPQFGGQQRSTNPQLVQFHNVQAHNPTQTIPVLRNMQFNMQIPAQAPGLQHGGGGSGAAGIAGQPNHLTVSAKAFSTDNQVPKVDSGGDNKDVVLGGIQSLGSPLVAGPPRPPVPLYRPPTQITTDVRFFGQPQFRPSLQPIQYHSPFPQPQKQRPLNMQANSAPKPQRIKKSRSKDGSQSSQSSLDSSDVHSGNTLEVYDLPSNMSRTEAENLLTDLVCAGAQLQYVLNDSCSNMENDGLTISDLKQVLAIFPNVTMASQTLQNHSNARYKLRVAMTTQAVADNIGSRS